MSLTATRTIFDLPPIVIKKLDLAELLDMLRTSVNSLYMPKSAGAVPFNSKPDYYKNGIEEFPDFPDVSIHDGSGFIAFDRVYGNTPIFVCLHVNNIQIVINLTTEEAIVRMLDDAAKFVRWPNDPTKTLAISRTQLKEEIDFYI